MTQDGIIEWELLLSKLFYFCLFIVSTKMVLLVKFNKIITVKESIEIFK
ncbi:hypothetical protein HNR53_001876 [Bacillus benzoevorans]|uniref:Uncharacterized protein n=1 Tax=Bacillus benzoevorans TaxID=1456 RepID=A0A7X0LV55_9BACI|nr:hypothetical protein [Bacillus benzoevorans]